MFERVAVGPREPLGVDLGEAWVFGRSARLEAWCRHDGQGSRESAPLMIWAAMTFDPEGEGGGEPHWVVQGV